MSARNPDHLPQTPAVSAIVRRVAFRLNSELSFNGHKPLGLEERAALFNLADASKILDGVACLPRMARPEERARRDLLELFDLFDQTLPTAAAPDTGGDEPACSHGRAALDGGYSDEGAETEAQS